MSELLRDTFTDADGTLLQSHTGESGATWSKYPGYTTDATITSNRLRGNGAEDFEFYYASAIPPSADYDVEVSLRLVTAVASDDPTVFARADHTVSAGNDTYYFVQYATDSAAWLLGKTVPGSFTSLGTFAQSFAPPDQPTVKFELRGTSLKVYIDGTPRISTTDAAIADRGRVAIATDRSDATTGWHVDSITATDHIVARRIRRTLEPAVAEPVFEFTW